MPTQQVTTYQDLVEHLLDYLGGDASAVARRDSRKAVLSALRNVVTGHRWSYFMQRGCITTVASQTDGTIEYDHTGGAYERMVTLTDGTWPDWAPYGVLLINNIPYEIEAKKSSSVVTLCVNCSPGEDIAAGTSYTLYRDTYTMPLDFVAADDLVNFSNVAGLAFVHPSDYVTQAHIVQSPATPRTYTFTSDPNLFGAMAIRFYPPPDQKYVYNFIYHRRSRSLLTEKYNTGAITTINSSATINASGGAAFTSRHAGCILRISSNNTDEPTAWWGTNPPLYERTILSVPTTTQLVVDLAIPENLSGVKYTISDPIDIEEGSLMTFLQREMEKQVRLLRRKEPAPEERSAYAEAWHQAREADSRHFGQRSAMAPGVGSYRLADMPYESGA